MRPFPRPNMVVLQLAIILHISIALAATSTFTEPPYDGGDYNRTYYLGQTVLITWNISSTQWPRVTIRISPACCPGPQWAITYGTPLNNATNNGGFLWTIGQNDGVNATVISAQNKFLFQMNDATGADPFTLDSREFYIATSANFTASTSTGSPTSTTPPSTSTTPPSTSTTPPSTSTTPPSTSTTPPSTSSLPPSTTASSSTVGGLDTSAKVGIGLGIPLAVIAGVSAVLLYVFIYRRRTRNEVPPAQAIPQPQRVGYELYNMVSGVPNEMEGTYKFPPAELQGKSQ